MKKENQMIKEIFGIPMEPFKREHPPLLKNQQDIMDVLLIHARQGGLNLVVGEPGTGKSVLRKEIERLGDGKKEYVIATIQRTIHTYSMILDQILDALGLTLKKGHAKEIEKLILKEAYIIHSQGRKLITIIDEAHLLHLDVLRKLRLLFDGFPKNHNIILFAQTEILHRLTLKVHQDIKSRITFSAKLLPLTEEQIMEFILNELRDAQLPEAVFDENAALLIAKSCEGNLRLCRNLAYGSLVEAVHLKQRTVNIQIVNRVLIQPHWRTREELIQQGA